MQKFVLLALIATLAVASAKPKWFELESYNFEKYVEDFRRSYEFDEHVMRRQIFNSNLEKIKAHNADGSKTWKEGVNHFTDKTEEERAVVLGLKKTSLYASKAQRQAQHTPMEIDISSLPTDVDWRTKGIITAVKDQGQCGSCWTFATTENLEAYWALATGQLQDLSEQQVLDCTPNPDQCGGTGGCQGGTVELAYARINALGGIASEWTYPYRSYNGQNFNTCSIAQAQPWPSAKVANYTDLPSNQYAPVLAHVATVGPLAVSVDASSWFAYEEGVYNGCNQTNPDLDHAVQLVGYGTDPTLGDYFLVRNSWNPTWGEEGYIRIARPANPPCGEDITPADGDGCKNGPPQVEVCGTCGILFDTAYPSVPQ